MADPLEILWRPAWFLAQRCRWEEGEGKILLDHGLRERARTYPRQLPNRSHAVSRQRPDPRTKHEMVYAFSLSKNIPTGSEGTKSRRPVGHLRSQHPPQADRFENVPIFILRLEQHLPGRWQKLERNCVSELCAASSFERPPKISKVPRGLIYSANLRFGSALGSKANKSATAGRFGKDP